MIHEAEKLLDDFRKLPGRVERPRTFMEIAGYPHYENVCSNILAFFMDPTESHGLGTLMLDALASAGNSSAADEGVGGNVSMNARLAPMPVTGSTFLSRLTPTLSSSKTKFLQV